MCRTLIYLPLLPSSPSLMLFSCFFSIFLIFVFFTDTCELSMSCLHFIFSFLIRIRARFCYVTAHSTRILDGDGTFLVVFVHYQKRTHVEQGCLFNHCITATCVGVYYMQARHRTDRSRLLYHWREYYTALSPIPLLF